MNPRRVLILTEQHDGTWQVWDLGDQLGREPAAPGVPSDWQPHLTFDAVIADPEPRSLGVTAVFGPSHVRRVDITGWVRDLTVWFVQDPADCIARVHHLMLPPEAPADGEG